jgi:hypothetical protein
MTAGRSDAAMSTSHGGRKAVPCTTLSQQPTRLQVNGHVHSIRRLITTTTSPPTHPQIETFQYSAFLACTANEQQHTCKHTHAANTQPTGSAHLSCCVSSKPTWPHFIAAYFSFRFQYSRNSVLQMPTNTAKYGMISAS